MGLGGRTTRRTSSMTTPPWSSWTLTTTTTTKESHLAPLPSSCNPLTTSAAPPPRIGVTPHEPHQTVQTGRSGSLRLGGGRSFWQKRQEKGLGVGSNEFSGMAVYV
ncbi:hypothetical protein QJS10_CPB22g00626 [Acorus calamus]|uniref:Uncharacterized protein n=1 Tax=Acorus calamus TaxID=4465 RepID=A0AAV9C084_ACOCL|nr:hypothetical protein QJS10_CPB22g00626 [Acorus calamus]